MINMTHSPHIFHTPTGNPGFFCWDCWEFPHFFGTKHGVCNIRVMELFHSIICKCVKPLDDDPHKAFSSSNVFFVLAIPDLSVR